MIRFAWLQSRIQVLVVAALLAVLAIAAAITGVHLSHLFHRDVATCTTECGFAINQFLSHYSFMDHALDILARVVPALVGLFWGAPLLAREFETGSYRLAWTQSVSRSRWVLTKLALGGLATVILAGILTLTITWWYTSRDQAGGSNSYAVFDRRDIAPIAYAAFAFAAGALIGALVRRTLPAMAATLGVFVFARIAISVWVRPHLLTPIRETLALPSGPSPGSSVDLGIGFRNGGAAQLFVRGHGPAQSWTVSSHLVDSTGHQPSSGQLAAFLHQHCPNLTPPPLPAPGQGPVKGMVPAPGQACLAQAAKAYHVLVSYQPANRYWTFQWLETGIFLALALAAAAGCYLWVTRRTN